MCVNIAYLGFEYAITLHTVRLYKGQREFILAIENKNMNDEFYCVLCLRQPMFKSIGVFFLISLSPPHIIVFN